MENNSLKQKMVDVFKKYGYYILLGVLVLGVVLTLIIASVVNTNSDYEESLPTNVNVSPFMPVMNATIYKGYYGDELVYNSTLKQWETHNGLDFQVANGSKVYSILDGKVLDVYDNILEGTVVVIEHDDGLVSTYGSLDDKVTLEKGDSVSRGQEIGTVSSSATAELDAGAHLHFSMTDNGEKIDPASYLNIETK